MLKKTLVKLIGTFGLVLLVSSCGSIISRNLNSDNVGNNQNENSNNNNSESSDFEKYFHLTDVADEGYLFTRIDVSEYPVGHECAEGDIVGNGDIYIKLIRQQGEFSGQMLFDMTPSGVATNCFILMNFNTEDSFEIIVEETMSFGYLYDEQEETFTMIFNDEQEETAPILDELVIAATGPSSITLSRPAFSIKGSPQPTVFAYIGLDGMISVDGSNISAYFESADVTSSDYQFSNLSPATAYRIIVVADNGVGYSVSEIVQATSTCTPVSELAIPDAGLVSAIRTAINKPTGDICQEELASLTFLDGQSSNIIDLTGMEYFTGLTTVYLTNNQIVDVSSLSGLTSLTNISLGGNQVTDISYLSGLTNLTVLELGFNNIVDISSLSGLTNLEYLTISGNQIVDISVLSGFTNLTYLALSSNNQITDASVSILAGLTNLTNLDFGGNSQITNISDLSSLTNLTTLNLNYNNIVDISVLSGLTGLISLSLGGNHITDISYLSGLTNLTLLDLNDNQIESITPLMTNFGAGGLVGANVSLSTNNLDAQALIDAQTLLDNGVNISW